ncbi:hypothetical protein ISN75_14215 [Dyella marensis]|uniref:hypothetical protein n=1 Tax=Dyella marensis TaxID=500610 RepID=UPI0031E19605
MKLVALALAASAVAPSFAATPCADVADLTAVMAQARDAGVPASALYETISRDQAAPLKSRIALLAGAAQVYEQKDKTPTQLSQQTLARCSTKAP